LAKHIRTFHRSVVIDAELASLDTQRQVTEAQECLEAVAKGNIDHVQRLRLNQKCDFRALSARDGETALHLAVEKGHEQMVRLLRTPDFDLDVNATDLSHNLPLHYAGTAEVADFLLQQDDMHVNDQNSDGKTPLQLAAAAGAADIVACLLDHGADITRCDNQGRSPLSRAAESGDHATVNLLIQGNEAMAENIDWNWHTPVWYAARHGHVDALKILSHPEISHFHLGKNRKSPLDVAVKAGHKPVVDFFINEGRSLNVTHLYCKAAATAAKCGQLQILQAFIQAGAHIDGCPSIFTPEKAPGSTIDELKGIGHSIDPQTRLESLAAAETKTSADYSINHGFTPLQAASWAGREDVVRFLRERRQLVSIQKIQKVKHQSGSPNPLV
jgi:ankyrin repeat protein